MKFKVGDLVENYFDEILVVIDTGFELRFCVDKTRKYQFVTLHYPLGRDCTIRSFESSAWSRLKVVGNG